MSLFKDLSVTVTEQEPEKQVLKKCTSCLKLKACDKYKFNYTECTACYAKKKNPIPTGLRFRLHTNPEL